jgi:hypothetical protein
MRLVRIAIIVASCGGLFGGTAATAVAGTFCDSPQANSKVWAPLCAQKASTVATPKVAAKNNNGCTPLLTSPGAGVSNPGPCCCSPSGNDRNTASCATYGPNTSFDLPVCTSDS